MHTPSMEDSATTSCFQVNYETAKFDISTKQPVIDVQQVQSPAQSAFTEAVGGAEYVPLYTKPRLSE